MTEGRPESSQSPRRVVKQSSVPFTVKGFPIALDLFRDGCCYSNVKINIFFDFILVLE